LASLVIELNWKRSWGSSCHRWCICWFRGAN